MSSYVEESKIMITTGSVVKAPFSYIDKPRVVKDRYGLVVSDEGSLKKKGRY